VAQPQWITAAGSLGVIPEGVFYSVAIEASAGSRPVFYRLIAGELPDGVQVTTNGIIEGSPRSIIRVQGVPQEVSTDVTSRFAIRAYTTVNDLSTGQVDRLADRTFELTVSGQDIPEFLTPPGNIGTFYDGTKISIPIRFTDSDPDDTVRINLLSGELPPGVGLNPRTGLISGIIQPLIGPPGTAPAGYDATEFDQYPFSFSTRAASRNYQFSLEITDGKESNVRVFEIYVYAKSTMRADTTDYTADNTFITADVTPDHVPVLLNDPGFLGRYRADNWFAYKFDAIDFDGDPVAFSITAGPGIGFDSASVPGEIGSYDVGGFDRSALSLPPGLTIDTETGWFYGYIPDQGSTEQTYQFGIRVYKANKPDIISKITYFTITIIGEIESEVIWLTPPDLGVIANGSISVLEVEAITVSGRQLQYRLAPGSDSRLPQGLTLQSSGHITGRVSFNTFALDGGTTTFDQDLNTRLDINETTFDGTYSFTVNAFASETEQIGYQVSSINIINGGSGYDPNDPPTVTISPPPGTEDAIQATAGSVTIVAGRITAIAVGNPGRGYLSPPTVTITGSGIGASASTSTIESQISNAVSVFRRFTVRVQRVFNTPYEKLYVKCMPPFGDRALISSLLQNQDIIPVSSVYRADDPNFGVAKNVVYDHAFGLTPASLETYVESLDINHYWKYVTLGGIRTARALDAKGNVLYEVIYSPVIDNQLNDAGQSVSKELELPYSVTLDDLTTVDVVYPNSLINMRDQVIDTVGRIFPALPQWMISKQENGQVLGFTPAWVIAYVNPGESGRISYNIRNSGIDLNVIDFKIDRYEIDRSQTWQWDNTSRQWEPAPPATTTFDTFTAVPSLSSWINSASNTVIWENQDSSGVLWRTSGSGIPQRGTIFDGGSTRFISPAVRWEPTDAFDKYLVFPRRDILSQPET
jgi:hypothetical protein